MPQTGSRPQNTLRKSHVKRRAGISEILGSLIMVAITLVAGAAVFGFVNGQSGNSANAVGKSAASNINFLNEREVVVYACLATSSGVCQVGGSYANVYVYNSGLINQSTIAQVFVTDNNANAVCGPIPTSTAIYKQKVGTITLSSSSCGFIFSSGSSYTFKVVGQFGSEAQATFGF